MEFPDFEEFIASLNDHRVRYLIVGAYALGFHARPRATKDIDVLVDRTPANARRVRACLTSFLGTPAPNITEARLQDPHMRATHHRPPPPLGLTRTHPTSVRWQACFARRTATVRPKQSSGRSRW